MDQIIKEHRKELSRLCARHRVGREQLFGRSIDLLMPADVKNPYFLRHIESSRTLLYAA